ncbi:MAG TPA: ATP-binding cassette domain-containing protein, partial [Acidimicrobiales bacterium]|nr:ATP-binding cassette domain-containing protein [Acidimicrobiales bacterium]
MGSPGDKPAPDRNRPGALALQVREVSVRFGGVQALQGVSLDAHAGCVTGLIGPNGAGKTTLFNVLSGLQRPVQGRILLNGRDITSFGPSRRAQLGLARTFQRLELFWSLSVEDNVRVGSESAVQWWRPRYLRHKLRRNGTTIPGAPGSPALGGRATRALLARVGLEDLGPLPVDSLPTGQARLVELARA